MKKVSLTRRLSLLQIRCTSRVQCV